MTTEAPIGLRLYMDAGVVAVSFEVLGVEFDHAVDIVDLAKAAIANPNNTPAVLLDLRRTLAEALDVVDAALGVSAK